MQDAGKTPAKHPSGGSEPLCLHIGGTEPKEGWRIFNIQPGPHVDFVGDCTSLARFGDDSVERIYACHVYEHLGHRGELLAALKDAHRVLIPGGLLQISVPDLVSIAGMLADPARTVEEQSMLMRFLFGSQDNQYDFHKVGLSGKLLAAYLLRAGFRTVRRVNRFGLFKDWSNAQVFGRDISLNVEAKK
jgi:predicted SAM-dependent methyltransferase